VDTLLLSTDVWDLVLDVSGNIAVATAPYALAQDVASACRLFRGECWYDQTKGIPYFEQILGHAPPVILIKAQLNSAAQTVPEIATSQTFLNIGTDRTMTGQVQATAISGATVAVAVPLSTTGNPFIIAVSDIGGSGTIA
jgi:hypothetical protein